jgi:hypothetical protein
MPESVSEPPDLLAIGVVRGGPSPANDLVNEALMGYMRLVIRERASFPNQGLRINIVFHVPGPIFQPDYVGVHATKLDRKTASVLIVAAVPDTLKFDEVSGYFRSILREARHKAIEYAAKRKVGVPADHVSGLIDHLLNPIGSGPGGLADH